MTIDTETIRDAAEVLDTLTSTLAVDHPLRTRAAARAKSCVSGLYSAADALDAQAAEIARLREAIQRAYGYLWHVNNEPGTPNRHAPEAMAYEARKALRDLLASEQRGDGINSARAALSGEGK